jgi:hypothetical protein
LGTPVTKVSLLDVSGKIVLGMIGPDAKSGEEPFGLPGAGMIM